MCTDFSVYWKLATRTNINFSLGFYNFFSAGDWLQGPHVYALYDSYGMTTHQIEILFVVGFGSSMIVGTVVGSFADKL